MVEMNAPSLGTPPKHAVVNANTEHDAALSLFNLIAKTENWWDGDDGVPTREELLACYADCVCAARGELPVRTPRPEPDADGSAIEMAEIIVVETTHHCAAVYEAAQDLGVSQDVEELDVIAPIDGVSFEA